MTEADKAFCISWIKAHARKWQVLNRSQWKYQFHEKTLVRFVEEVQLREDEIPLLLEYLASDECIPTLCLYDQTISSEWKPTRAWLELSNKSVGNVHSVRLYHGLMTELSAIGDGPYLVENGCVSKVSLSYYWDQSSVQTVPASSSGISYRITGLTRDRDTGLYTYAIEKRERVQQDVAEYFTAKTAFADMSEEYHLGVRQDDVATTGQAASVNNGKIVRRKISKNADCTSDVHNTIEQEIAVPGASEAYHKSLTGMTKTVVNRNMPTKASEAGLDIGESVENTETDGKRWNQRITTIVRTFIGRIADSCSKTIFHHRQGQTDIQGTDPGFTHVVDASGGVIHSKAVSRTSDGSYRIEDNTTTELPVSSASVRVHKTLRGVVKSTTNRNQGSPLATEGLGIGESVENSKTEGGLYNTTKTEATHESVGRISVSEEEDRHSKQRAEQSNVATDPGEPGVTFTTGKVEHKAVRITENGTWDVNESLVAAKPSKVIKRWHDAYNFYVLCNYRNQQEPLVPDSYDAYTHTNVGFTLNHFGLYDGHYSTTTKTSFSGGESGGKQKVKNNHKRQVRLYFTPGACWGRNAKKVRWYRMVDIEWEEYSACGPSAVAEAYDAVDNASPSINTDDGSLPNGLRQYDSKVIHADFQSQSAAWRILKRVNIQKAWNMETVQ